MTDPIYTLRQGDRFSYETIDLDVLRSLQTLPEWLKEHKRMRGRVRWTPKGAAGYVPPGHPRHFLTAPEHGRGDMEVRVIADPNNLAFVEVSYDKENNYQPRFYWGDKPGDPRENVYYVVQHADIKRLWKRLPWDHLRMQIWELDCYTHFRHTYKGHDGEYFFHPMGSWQSKVYEPRIDPHWTEEYKEEVTAEYLLAKAAEKEAHDQYASRWATPERHMAVRTIRGFFPGYQPNQDLIDHPEKSEVKKWMDSYDWYRLYPSLEAQQNDPIFQLQHRSQ